MPFRLLRSADCFWRRSNQMGVLNTDLAKQLAADSFGARLWRIEPGRASTRHRHRQTTELYLLLEGTGKLRVDGELLELAPMDSVLVEPGSLRQPFNDTDADQLWLIFGAPPELANTVEMNPEDLAWLYPDGPKALPPELEGH
ncbi:MAG TPA: cupin domain-containing protein [Solirubrobacterales bacterium]|nr:cupin domain-containing protein [Solirubrobacterales bacterium]